jgi:hypothetical protein
MVAEIDQQEGWASKLVDVEHAEASKLLCATNPLPTDLAIPSRGFAEASQS